MVHHLSLHAFWCELARFIHRLQQLDHPHGREEEGIKPVSFCFYQGTARFRVIVFFIGVLSSRLDDIFYRFFSFPGFSVFRDRKVVPSKIWEEFPHELFPDVIARLPMADIFRSRSVSKEWNFLVSHRSFCEKLPRHNHPWFYFSCDKSKHGFIYDPYLNKWYNTSIPSLPNSELLNLHASAGGLVCFQDTRSKQIYVCNPITGSFRELQQPPPSSDDYEVIVTAMALNGNFTSNGYKILSVNFRSDFEVYDSVQNSWFQLKDTPMFIKDFFSDESLPLYMAIESTVYFILDHRSDRIVSCDLATGVWQQLAIQPLPYPKQSVSLAEWRGKIMLVGIVGEDNNTTPCVCVWELQKITLSWKEVDRMSMELYGGDFLINCFVNQGSCLHSLRSQKGSEFISYDMETRAWRFVPMPLKRKTLNLWRWIFNPFVEMKYGGAFYPSLTASP